jgi:cholesterol transport system auxiliary component
LFVSDIDGELRRRFERGVARAFAVLMLAAGLAGCGAPALTSYDLVAIPSAGPRAGAIRGVLAIAEPTSDEAFNSTRIVVRAEPNQLAYLTGAQWSERLPALVQSRLIGSFENARFLKSVTRPGGASDYDLSTEIRRFEIDVATGEARVEIAAKILSDRSGRPMIARVFTAAAPAPRTADGAAAAALDEALGKVMRDIVTWTAKAI